MIQRMPQTRLKEIFDNHLVVDKCDYAENGDLVAYIKSYAVFDYLKALLGTDSNGYEINQDVLCAADFGAPQKRKRFIVIGIKKSLTDTVQLPIGIFQCDLSDGKTRCGFAECLNLQLIQRKILNTTKD